MYNCFASEYFRNIIGYSTAGYAYILPSQHQCKNTLASLDTSISRHLDY